MISGFHIDCLDEGFMIRVRGRRDNSTYDLDLYVIGFTSLSDLLSWLSEASVNTNAYVKATAAPSIASKGDDA